MEVTGMRTNSKFLISTIALSIISSNTFAQSNLQPTGFLAEVVTAVGYDDNILRTSDSLKKKDTYLQLKPELGLVGIYGKHKFESKYTGNYSVYSKYNEVNYDDHKIQLKGTFDHSISLNTIVNAGFNQLHEEPGDTDQVIVNFSEFSIHNDSFAEVRFEYGQDDSIGKLIFGYRKSKVDYINNNQDFRDRVEDRFVGRFYYRIANRTRLLAEAIYVIADYDQVGSLIERDNTNTIYRTGVSWDVTDLLTGEVKVGYQKRDFDVEQAIDFDGLSYEAEVKWLPLSYSTWKLKARRQTFDSSLEQAGSFLRSSYSIEIDHKFTDRTKLYTVLGLNDDELLTTTGREDNGYNINVSLNHKINRIVELGVGAAYETRDSTFEFANYTSRSVRATIKLILD